MFVYLDREQIFFFFLDFYLVYQREVALFLAVIRIWVRPCVCVSAAS